ncbi:(2Fe-2S)-binding protein [Inhella sp.]|uniref:(2Fe-2S)-binding protein n=1 Tax=Inhella sp. TaxID=1921806 RepID=UPI0035B28C0A
MPVLEINRHTQDLNLEPDMPLLWALRDELGLTATKFGCGVAACGACTVHLDGEAARSCMLPLGGLQGRQVTTLEGLRDDALMQRLQAAWLAEQVPQCGYCQSGMLMAAHALLRRHPQPSEAQIEAAMSNLCRCGTYPRIRRALRRAQLP